MEGVEQGLPLRWGQLTVHVFRPLLALTRQWWDQGWVGTVILIALAFTGGSAYGGRRALG